MAFAVGFHHVDREPNREGGAVRSIARKSVEDVRGGRNPAGDGYLVAGELLRVPAPVPPLVMVQGNRCGQAHDLGVRIAQDPIADLCVGLHPLKLVPCQTPGLEKNAVRNADLADVVKFASEAQALAVFLWKSQLEGNQLAIAAHPLHVRASRVVAELRQADETPKAVALKNLGDISGVVRRF